MKIQLLSDLHFEVDPTFQPQVAADAQLLVLAGDIGAAANTPLAPHGRDDFYLSRFSPKLGNWPVPVVYVPGNHEFDGQDFILEKSLTADIALVKAYKADKAGNLIFRKTAQNFNPVCAMAGKISIAEVEEIVEIGDLDPDEIHLPGIYINRIVLNAHPEKRIEQMTLKTEV